MHGDGHYSSLTLTYAKDTSAQMNRKYLLKSFSTAGIACRHELAFLDTYPKKFFLRKQYMVMVVVLRYFLKRVHSYV